LEAQKTTTSKTLNFREEIRMINKELLDYLIDDYERGKTKWMRTALELRFSKQEVDVAIESGLLVDKKEHGEVHLAFQVPGTLQHALQQALPNDFANSNASALLQILARQGQLVDTLCFMDWAA
jgi:hypothetical protein